MSIVVAARDEAAAVEPAVRSMAQQGGGSVEVVAVDDRSSDGTGDILERLAAELDNLRVLHVEELPEGWLGKNHALAQGAAAARGEWLVFTDADVMYTGDVVMRAVGSAERQGLDHLTVLPQVVASGLWIGALVNFFGLLFIQTVPPSAVRSGRIGVGVGAFNMVHREMYRQAGGHAAIRLRPDDDVELGALLQAQGARQALLVSAGELSIEWYSSVSAAFGGYEKNVYSLTDYRPVTFAALWAGAAYVYLFPALWTTAAAGLALKGISLPGWPLAAGALVVMWMLALTVAREAGLGMRHGWLTPVGACLLWWAGLRAVWLTERRGGIYWRETFYPLELLRESRSYR